MICVIRQVLLTNFAMRHIIWHMSVRKKRAKKAPAAKRAGTLETQYRTLMVGFRPSPLVPLADPPVDERYIVQTVTTYGAYEEPL